MARKRNNWCEAGLLPPGVTQLEKAFQRGQTHPPLSPGPWEPPPSFQPRTSVPSLPPTSQLEGKTHISR